MDQQSLSSRVHSAFEERYQIPLAAAILLLALEAALSDRAPASGRQTGRSEDERAA